MLTTTFPKRISMITMTNSRSHSRIRILIECKKCGNTFYSDYYFDKKWISPVVTHCNNKDCQSRELDKTKVLLNRDGRVVCHVSGARR